MDDGLHRGVVAAFDDDRGYGDVQRADNQHAYFFHCTQIADGSRTIAIGTDVTFRLVPGRMGRWEATAVTPNVEPIAGVERAPAGGVGLCPVCSTPVPGEPGTYEICRRCGWEDDPAQRADPSYAGGANTMSLVDAQQDWRRRQS